MTNQITRTPKENSRKRILSALTPEVDSSDDDDNVTDGIDICNIVENQINQRKRVKTYNALKALGETIRNTLLEINEIREQNRERRHKELLQMLTKITEQDNEMWCEETNSGRNICFDQQTSQETNAGQDYTKKRNITHIANDLESKNGTVEKASSELDEIYLDCSATAKEDCSTNYRISAQTQINNIKTVTAVKPNEKKELERMRAKMLEMQRKKMEDRERKKRAHMKTENL